MNVQELQPLLDEWSRTELAGMVQHISSTRLGGCSIERWITLSMGRFLCQRLGINPANMQYEKRYPDTDYKCDLWIDGYWIEVKHIWPDTQAKVFDYLDWDVERIRKAGSGTLVIFEIGKPTWYLNWKTANSSNALFVS